MPSEIETAWIDEADCSCRAVVLTGAGRAFSPGFDLQDRRPIRQMALRSRPIPQRDFDGESGFGTQKPTIAAVNGPALAVDELAMACDITIAGASATFGEPEVKFGAGIVVMLLPWIVGPKKAKEIAFSEEINNAREACDLGIVNQVVPDEEVQSLAMEMARAIAVVDPMVRSVLNSKSMKQ